MADKTIIAGIDEAGRGALAGPVVAGACVLNSDKKVPKLIADSKKLTAQQRDEAMSWIRVHCSFGIGVVDAGYIDQFGILAATELAMQTALQELQKVTIVTYALVDGRDAFWFDVPHSSIIRGDESEPVISAASIIAKTHRDALMSSLPDNMSRYGFDQHKGYGTPKHIKALRQHGHCQLHRQTFLRRIMAEAYASS